MYAMERAAEKEWFDERLNLCKVLGNLHTSCYYFQEFTITLFCSLPRSLRYKSGSGCTHYHAQVLSLYICFGCAGAHLTSTGLNVSMCARIQVKTRLI